MDVEIEVDTDAFGERIVERDEPHLDRHLQVLQPPQLIEQVGDLFVNLLRLADHQAEIGLEGHHRPLAADGVPAGWGHRLLNQVNEGLEVGLGAAGFAERRRGRGASATHRSSLQLAQYARVGAAAPGCRRQAHAVGDAGWRRANLNLHVGGRHP